MNAQNLIWNYNFKICQAFTQTKFCSDCPIQLASCLTTMK